MSDRSYKVEIIRPVNIYEEPNPSAESTPTGILLPREKLRVLRVQFDAVNMNVKVQRKNGDTGWMIFNYESAEMNDY